MEQNTSDNMDDTKAAAENMANRTGEAAKRVGNAAKSAGKQVGDVASEELANLRADLDDLISRIPVYRISTGGSQGKTDAKVASTREAATDLAHEPGTVHTVANVPGVRKGASPQSVGYAAASAPDRLVMTRR